MHTHAFTVRSILRADHQGGVGLLWTSVTQLEYRVLTTTLLPLGFISPGYLLYKAYDLYTVRSEGIARDGPEDYDGKYHDVWVEPIMATLSTLCARMMTYAQWPCPFEDLHTSQFCCAGSGLGVITRLVLLVLMLQTRRNFGTGLKGFSMHREYLLPERLRAALTPVSVRRRGLRATMNTSLSVL